MRTCPIRKPRRGYYGTVMSLPYSNHTTYGIMIHEVTLTSRPKRKRSRHRAIPNTGIYTISKLLSLLGVCVSYSCINVLSIFFLFLFDGAASSLRLFITKI